MPCRSRPVPGSVIAIAVIISPVQNFGSQRCFCSSLASSSKYGATMSLCSPKPIPLYRPAVVSSVMIVF